MDKTKHNNKETVVKCPIDGCEHTGVSRGMHLHVRQSSGNGHGEHGDTPEHIDFSELEVVGEKNVEMNYPDERENEEDVVRLCPFCGRAFHGYRGISIHLGQKQGQGVHPEDATETEKDDCPIAHVDDDMNVIEIVEENSIMPSTKRRVMNDSSVSESDVLALVEEFESDGDEETAERIRSALL